MGKHYAMEQPIRISTTPTIQLDDWMAVPSDMHRKYTINYHGRVRTTGATIMSMRSRSCGDGECGALIRELQSVGISLLHWHSFTMLALNCGDSMVKIVDLGTLLHPDAKTPTMICAPQDQFQHYRDTIHNHKK
jgi:hypothetical protein